MAVAVAAMGAGCGGDDRMAPAPSQAAATPARSVRALALTTDPAAVAEISRLLDWAERQFPELFPTSEINQVFDPYIYRFYPRSGNYLGVDGRAIRVLGPVSNNQMLEVGTLDDYACQVQIELCRAPAITQPPEALSVAVGAAATFTAAVGGGPSIRLQWLRDGQPVPGATSPVLSFIATATDQGASFSLRADNAKGSVTSAAASLTVQRVIDAVALQALAQSRGCFSCHDLTRTGTGPSFRSVALRYRSVAGAQALVSGRIVNGSSRQWGLSSAMSPQPVTEEEASDLAAWILSLR